MNAKTGKISKVLSKNDTGETGGHQAGILVPKDPRILDYFPDIGNNEKNPRVRLSFIDDNGDKWKFTFIYYNNVFYGGTRNEYRLTWMTEYIRVNGLKAGNVLFFFFNDEGERRITYKKVDEQKNFDDGVLRIGKSWRVINI